MFGNKLRSWMEAVRPKKKQQRKEKSSKNGGMSSNSALITNKESVCKARFSKNEVLQEIANCKSSHHEPRYSGTNLSSPESAYSTGYSTDGTSPGAPPEYYINIRTGTKYFRNGEKSSPRLLGQSCSRISNSAQVNESYSTPKREHAALSARFCGNYKTNSASQEEAKDVATCAVTNVVPTTNANITFQSSVQVPKGLPVTATITSTARFSEVVVTSCITSPRQRNRIRTNPWLPGNSLSPGSSSVALQIPRQDSFGSPLLSNPVTPRFPNSQTSRGLTKQQRRESLSSSSSCSSLSRENSPWDSNLVRTNSRLDGESDEEEDCTLNEMMGKYDESYVYEKETDILSDSDPTDCETDIDTGQDGGDEEEPTEKEFDFIDNGSLKEFGLEKEIRNTGHCVYFNYEGQIRQPSRRRTTRRSQRTDQKNTSSEKRRRSNSFKKRHKHTESPHKIINRLSKNGSRSAGATPVSVRRTKYSSSKTEAENLPKKRSNSVSFSDSIKLIDRRDIEADRKYKELIVEAEHILMNMKTNCFSPRRLPTPANKRVELLRSGESSVKSDVYLRNRLIEDTANLHLSKIPSNNFNPSRCSPKKNHITNFINNNSSVLFRRECDPRVSPLESRKELLSLQKRHNEGSVSKKKHLSPKLSRKSPKFRKKVSKAVGVRHSNASSTSEDESETRPKRNAAVSKQSFICPQSEPVKRKVYFKDYRITSHNDCQGGSLCSDTSKPYDNNRSGYEENNSTENLRQQALLNTIASLKRSLEDQSASLKQVYRSTQDINV